MSTCASLFGGRRLRRIGVERALRLKVDALWVVIAGVAISVIVGLFSAGYTACLALAGGDRPKVTSYPPNRLECEDSPADPGDRDVPGSPPAGQTVKAAERSTSWGS